MATILFSSDTAPLSSVIICCTIAASLSISKEELFTGGVWTDWPGFCALGCVVGWVSDLSTDVDWLLLRHTAERSREWLSLDDVSGGEYPSCWFFLWLLWFCSEQFFLRVAAAAICRGMWSLAFLQFAVASARWSVLYLFFWTVLV
jgi:hypothetical protein